MDAQNRKVVIGFVAGLVLGALLVWVWTVASKPTTEETAEQTTSATQADVAQMNEGGSEASATPTETSETAAPTERGGTTSAAPVSTAGIMSNALVFGGVPKLDVKDQSAGNTVIVADGTVPAVDGWLVVRDYDGSNLGNIIGAARFGGDYWTTHIELVRPTVAGSQYAVEIFTDNGDRTFSSVQDAPYLNPDTHMPVMDTFTAR